MTLVLDPSAALAWAYSDESSTAVDEVIDQVIESGAWVPAIWHLEVANSLEHSVRRGRIDRAFRDAALSDFEDLAISIDPDTSLHAWATTLQLAERYRLTLYDAAYLELADRLGLPLATLDRELRLAAEARGVPLLGA